MTDQELHDVINNLDEVGGLYAISRAINNLACSVDMLGERIQAGLAGNEHDSVASALHGISGHVQDIADAMRD